MEDMEVKIISIRKGFTADHSSTSYEFLAVDKALGKNERAEVASLSSRAKPTSRRVSFIYHVEGYDIPGGWEKLMEKYYDVMYSESYDWWTFVLAFNTRPEQIEELRKYELVGEDDLGITIRNKDRRVIIEMNCRIDTDYLCELTEHGYEEVEEDEDEDDDKDTIVVAGDELLNLLTKVRQQLMHGDYRTLYAVWEQYGFAEDEESEEEFQIPIPPEKKTGQNIVEQFRNILGEME
jgi:hypothetical protein